MTYQFSGGNWSLKLPGWLRQITCGDAGVWGINPLGDLYSFGDGGNVGWAQVKTNRNTFTWISSGAIGKVWAVDEDGAVFRKGSDHEWIEVEGPGTKMMQVDVFNRTVWGVDINNQIWYRSTTA